MKVLISVASKHGATNEIGAHIRESLLSAGLDAEVVAPDAVTELDGYDAVILGSAIYGGQWRPEVKTLVERLQTQLQQRPVWLFSSGPLGDPPVPADDPPDAVRMVESTGAEEHVVFAGKLDRSKLNLLERSMVKAVKAPYGDFRDWDEISRWADRISRALSNHSVARI